MNSVQVAFTFALGRAARLRVVSAEHFPSLRVNKVHLRTDRAIHRHKLARVRSLVFLRDGTLTSLETASAIEVSAASRRILLRNRAALAA